MFSVLNPVRRLIVLGVIAGAVTAGKRWSRRVGVLSKIGGIRRRIRRRVRKLRRVLVMMMVIGIVISSRLHL